MRRLPIFFVLDVSESMIGEDLRSLESGVGEIVSSLRGDAHALETVHLSVLAFAGKARLLTPLMDLVSFYAPRLPVGSGTSLGAALNLLMDEIDSKVVRRSATQKGDYRPFVYLMTDGRPTDDVEPAIKRWANYEKRAHLVAVAIGEHADTSVLSRLTPHVIMFNQRNPGDFEEMIRWVTASITVQSQAVESGTVSLAKTPSGVLDLLKEPLSKTVLDDRVVVLEGRCQRHKVPYLLKFAQLQVPSGMKVDHSMYGIVGAYAVSEDYASWSDPALVAPTINTSRLLGGAGCPHCANRYAFAVCGCGKLHCIGGDGEATCPWCSKLGRYGIASEDDPGQDVERGRG